MVEAQGHTAKRAGIGTQPYSHGICCRNPSSDTSGKRRSEEVVEGEEDRGSALKSRLTSYSHPLWSMKPLGAELSTRHLAYISMPEVLFSWLANSYSSFRGPARLSSLWSFLLWPLANILTMQVMVMLLPLFLESAQRHFGISASLRLSAQGPGESTFTTCSWSGATLGNSSHWRGSWGTEGKSSPLWNAIQLHTRAAARALGNTAVNIIEGCWGGKASEPLHVC